MSRLRPHAGGPAGRPFLCSARSRVELFLVHRASFQKGRQSSWRSAGSTPSRWKRSPQSAHRTPMRISVRSMRHNSACRRLVWALAGISPQGCPWTSFRTNHHQVSPSISDRSSQRYPKASTRSSGSAFGCTGQGLFIRIRRRSPAGGDFPARAEGTQRVRLGQQGEPVRNKEATFRETAQQKLIVPVQRVGFVTIDLVERRAFVRLGDQNIDAAEPSNSLRRRRLERPAWRDAPLESPVALLTDSDASIVHGAQDTTRRDMEPPCRR